MIIILVFISIAVFIPVLICVSYIWIIALASIVRLPVTAEDDSRINFAIAIPAHNEAEVIGETIDQLIKLDYPKDLFKIFVVADNCDDETAEIAKAHGAECFERTTSVRSGKGEALKWLFEKIFKYGSYEGVIVFDADTRVDAQFLKVIKNRLANNAWVIQGKHIISNPQHGWFPALVWAMMSVDCRLFSQGRSNLGLSARHMGDSICFRTHVLEKLGWGQGLTEDYEFRLHLILNGIRIVYESKAVGYGQAPATWKEAESQRVRWARGTIDSSRRFRKKLIKEGIKNRSWLQVDGALSVTIPSYSTLTILSIVMLFCSLPILLDGYFSISIAWLGVLFMLFIYPLFGLVLEKAPVWSYVAIIAGPFFMLWRLWIQIMARVRGKNTTWIRTQHRKT